MPSEYSLYRKIQVVLDVAKSVKVDSIDQLGAEIKGRRLPNFLSRRYDREKDVFVTDISDKSIRRAVTLCAVLGLVGHDGTLLAKGRQALQRIRYDRVVAGQVRAFLKGKGVNIHELNRVILESLQSSPPVLPTSKELWTITGSPMSRGMFSKMLTLLAHCGGAKSSQKKIYLHVDTR